MIKQLTAITVYQWRLNDQRPWEYRLLRQDMASLEMLNVLAQVGQARAFEFRNKSVAELRREGWVR